MSTKAKYQKFVDDNKLPVLLDISGSKDEILIVTLNRPRNANSIPSSLHPLFDEFWTLFEKDPNLRVAILTGKGPLFSAGADLKEWLVTAKSEGGRTGDLEKGFLGISNRSNKKPIIAALNGSSYGGGTETLLNCDLVVALRSATICLPEVRVGVTALAGALPRLGRTLSLQQANELALIAEPISAETALNWGIVNRIAETPEQVMELALDLANKICLGIPEGIYISQRGVRKGYEDTSKNLQEATRELAIEAIPMAGSPNQIAGLAAFSARKKPTWGPSKL